MKFDKDTLGGVKIVRPTRIKGRPAQAGAVIRVGEMVGDDEDGIQFGLEDAIKLIAAQKAQPVAKDDFSDVKKEASAAEKKSKKDEK
jgi:hypothetical protein